MKPKLSLLSWSLCLLACNQTGPLLEQGEAGQAGQTDSPTAVAGPPEPDHGCRRAPAPASRGRKVVISHPYDAMGNQTNLFEVLDLSADGALTRTGTTFRMGLLTEGEIHFTPDGAVGLVAQDDGTVGVFRFERDGSVTVVHAGFDEAGYATSLTMDQQGDRVYVLSDQWRESGGGIFSARIQCDGSLVAEGLVAPAKLAGGMVWLPPRQGHKEQGRAPRAVVAAADILDSAAGDSVHLLRWSSPPTVLGGADGFGDDQAIVSAVSATPDGRFVLVGDNSAFSGIDNRIAVVRVGDGGLSSAQVLTPVLDPVAIVMSPFGDAGLVTSGFGDALLALRYDPAATPPLSVTGPIAYVGQRPQLPYTSVLIERGLLRGMVLVAENEGVRRVTFAPGGAITDLGLTETGTTLDSIVGGLGVQP